MRVGGFVSVSAQLEGAKKQNAAAGAVALTVRRWVSGCLWVVSVVSPAE